MKTSIKYYVLSIMGILLLYITPTVYAEVKLGEKFGFGDIKSLGEGTSRLVVPAFSIASSIVVILFLIGAFKYIISGGDKEQVAAARNTIAQALIGFIILMFVFFILPFVLSSLLGITFFRIF